MNYSCNASGIPCSIWSFVAMIPGAVIACVVLVWFVRWIAGLFFSADVGVIVGPWHDSKAEEE